MVGAPNAAIIPAYGAPQPHGITERVAHMKMNRRLLLALTLLGLASDLTQPFVRAAETAAARSTGSISGRVQNAVTGQYLNNARVTVQGTGLVAFTDQSGAYQLVNVPAGTVTLEVFYTDLDVQRLPLALKGDENLNQDIGLTSVTRYGADPNVVRINPFVVGSDKDTDANAIAVNEQRFAPNIKNVVSTDAQGDILGSNVGEFIKLLPGVSGEYSGVEMIGISVRGLGSGLTSFTSNGAPMVSAFFVGGVAGGGRDFNINTMAMNDVSRVEVTKVPTPSSPADSLAGSVNMVSKSAFERSKPELRLGLSLASSSGNLTFKKTPHSNGDHDTMKTMVGFDFDYTLPITKNFGIVLAGMQSNRFNEQQHTTLTYSGAGTATGASFDRPYLQSYAVIDSPRTQRRTTFGLNADWRVTRHSVLTLNSQWSRYKNYIGALTWTFSPGTVGTPTPATGTPFSFGPDFVTGATGRGSVTMNGGAQTYGGGGTTIGLNYRLDDGTWRIEAGLSHSDSEIYRANAENGAFGGLAATLINPVRVSFAGINAIRPGIIQTFAANNDPVDVYNIANYTVTSATDTPVNHQSGIDSANLSLRRTLGFLPFPASLQIGGTHRIQTLDARRRSLTWTHNGPDGIASTVETATPYLMQRYINQDSNYGFRNVPWISPSRAWSAQQARPSLFSQTAAQVVAAETFRIANSEYIEEAVSALYLQAEAKFIGNRLRILTGVRMEKTTDEGQGMLFNPNAVFVQNPDGTFARNAQGARIRGTEAGAVGSMEELRLTRTERAYRANRTYDGYYPSLHVSYEVRENLLVRAAYAKTYGRPAFTDIIPSATINEFELGAEQAADPTIAKGSITVRNTALKPWTADNFDLSAEYYNASGGVLSAGVFLKDIKNFFGDSVRLATAADLELIGLDPRYVGWNLVTKFNSGDAQIRGVEFNLRQSLRALGSWGRHFAVFANATKLNLEGSGEASFSTFIPKTGNWGFSFNRSRFTFVAKWNYRGRDTRVAQPLYGPGGFEFFKARTNLDLNASFQLHRRFSLVANVNNVFNVPQTILRYGTLTPEYARQWRRSEYGVSLALGLRGTF